MSQFDELLQEALSLTSTQMLSDEQILQLAASADTAALMSVAALPFLR